MQDNERRFFMMIAPSNTSAEGPPDCRLKVFIDYDPPPVIDEPVQALHANDETALQRERASVANRLGVPIENIRY